MLRWRLPILTFYHILNHLSIFYVLLEGCSLSQTVLRLTGSGLAASLNQKACRLLAGCQCRRQTAPGFARQSSSTPWPLPGSPRRTSLWSSPLDVRRHPADSSKPRCRLCDAIQHVVHAPTMFSWFVPCLARSASLTDSTSDLSATSTRSSRCPVGRTCVGYFLHREWQTASTPDRQGRLSYDKICRRRSTDNQTGTVVVCRGFAPGARWPVR